MREYNYQIRILVTFLIMLSLGMLIQTVLLFFLNVRDSIKTDVQFSLQSLEQKASWIGQTKVPLTNPFWRSAVDTTQLNENQHFTCEYIDLAVGDFAQSSTCNFLDKVKDVSRQVVKNNSHVVSYTSMDTASLFFSVDLAIMGVPIRDSAGNVIGSIVAERSLQHIYQRFERETKLALCYLMGNLLILGVIFFIRISKLIFKPLENLVQKADTYQSDENTFFITNGSVSPFRKLSSSLNAFLGRIERDNSRLRKHVEDLKVANSELQDKNELVLRSEKLATVGVLSAGLAHEIGNPLSIIQGYVDLLKRNDLTNDERKQFTQKSQDELDRIKRLILQLLDYSRSETSSVLENVSMRDMIEGVVAFISCEKLVSQCCIKTIFHDEDDRVVCNHDGFKQVLINCLLNAADATSDVEDTESKILITTSIKREDSGKSFIVLDIIDNGPGVNEEHLSSLFDPFFTTKDVGKGTGLGLFVSYMIMEKMGGSITLKNAEEGGAVVRLILPLKK